MNRRACTPATPNPKTPVPAPYTNPAPSDPPHPIVSIRYPVASNIRHSIVSIRYVSPDPIVSIRYVVASVVMLFFAGIGCAPTPPRERGQEARGEAVTGETESADRLAIVNGETITRGQFDHRLESLPEYARVRYRSQQRKRSYLDAVIQFEALADEAERRGLGSTPRARQAVKGVLADYAFEQTLGEDVSMEDVSQGAIEQYYRSHRDRFSTPERRRVALIGTNRREWAEELKARVESTDPDQRINRFRQLAARYSVSPEPFEFRREGGAAGWVEPPAEEVERTELSEVVFGLDNHKQVTAPFRYRDGWYVAMWFERKEAEETSLEDAAETIRRTLYDRRRRERSQELSSKWRRRAEVDIRDTIVEGLAAPPKTRYTRREQLPLKTVDPD